MTIYNLMLKVSTLKIRVEMAYTAYKEKKTYYWAFDCEALTVIDTLEEMNYITVEEWLEYKAQLYHIFRMYKRH